MSHQPMPDPFQQPYRPHQPGRTGGPLQPSPTSPATSVRETARRRFRSGLSFAALYVIVIWAVHLVNVLFFGGTLHPTFAQNTALAIVDWVAGVAFAYPTNRKWVFQSKNPNILAEAGGFVASRLATLGMDWAVTQLLGTVLGINVYVTWFIKSVLVFLGNYILSKLFVFKKKKEE